jgi:hypothetical protein
VKQALCVVAKDTRTNENDVREMEKQNRSLVENSCAVDLDEFLE